jgi:hypothetical protein
MLWVVGLGEGAKFLMKTNSNNHTSDNELTSMMNKRCKKIVASKPAANSSTTGKHDSKVKNTLDSKPKSKNPVDRDVNNAGEVSRRKIVRAGIWSAPVITGVVSAPSEAASPQVGLELIFVDYPTEPPLPGGVFTADSVLEARNVHGESLPSNLKVNIMLSGQAYFLVAGKKMHVLNEVSLNGSDQVVLGSASSGYPIYLEETAEGGQVVLMAFLANDYSVTTNPDYNAHWDVKAKAKTLSWNPDTKTFAQSHLTSLVVGEQVDIAVDAIPDKISSGHVVFVARSGSIKFPSNTSNISVKIVDGKAKTSFIILNRDDVIQIVAYSPDSAINVLNAEGGNTSDGKALSFGLPLPAISAVSIAWSKETRAYADWYSNKLPVNEIVEIKVDATPNHTSQGSVVFKVVSGQARLEGSTTINDSVSVPVKDGQAITKFTVTDRDNNGIRISATTIINGRNTPATYGNYTGEVMSFGQAQPDVKPFGLQFSQDARNFSVNNRNNTVVGQVIDIAVDATPNNANQGFVTFTKTSGDVDFLDLTNNRQQNLKAPIKAGKATGKFTILAPADPANVAPIYIDALGNDGIGFLPVTNGTNNNTPNRLNYEKPKPALKPTKLAWSNDSKTFAQKNKDKLQAGQKVTLQVMPTPSQATVGFVTFTKAGGEIQFIDNTDPGGSIQIPIFNGIAQTQFIILKASATPIQIDALGNDGSGYLNVTNGYSEYPQRMNYGIAKT